MVEAGADWLHLDIMDGQFVDNISFGPGMVKTIRGLTNLPLDVHLMIERADHYVPRFIEAGANSITFVKSKSSAFLETFRSTCRSTSRTFKLVIT